MNRINIDTLKNEYIGKVFGSLEVQDILRDDNNFVVFRCKCTCGNIKDIPYKRVIRGHTKSCGCRSSTAKRLDVSAIKREYVGKQINWLTIEDVFRDEISGFVLFRCKCRCGNIRDVSKKVLLGKRAPISCGCYKRSEERSVSQKQYYKDHPECILKISEKRKRWAKENPEKCKAVGKHNSELYDKEPSRRLAVGKRISQWCKDNTDRVKELADARSKWFDENPDLVKAASDKRVQYLRDHPEIELARRSNISKWAKENPEKVNDIANKNANIALEKRSNTDYSVLFSIVKPSYISKLKSGNIKAGDLIETKCPCCGKYAPHSINNIFVISRANFKGPSGAPLCKECHIKLTSSLTSKYEQELMDYISEFYLGECIQNDRNILNGKELDLYYPKKKIAIEFNGDYWHSEEFKDKNYHYNKFKECRDKDILLVSIFESKWASRKDDIKRYLVDLFNDKENKLSFERDNYMNNNYPSFEREVDIDDITDDFYAFKDVKVYTCGYSRIKSN